MRAFSHWRWTVRSETPCIAPISAKEKPLKNLRSTISASGGSTAVSSSTAAPMRASSWSSGTAAPGSVDERRDLERAAALQGLTAARVVDDEAPHHLGGIAHESRAVGKDRLAAGDVEVRLVEQGGRADRRPGAVSGQLALGQPMELGVEGREKRVGRGAVAVLGGGDEGRDGGGHGILKRVPPGPAVVFSRAFPIFSVGGSYGPRLAGKENA